MDYKSGKFSQGHTEYTINIPDIDIVAILELVRRLELKYAMVIGSMLRPRSHSETSSLNGQNSILVSHGGTGTQIVATFTRKVK